MGVSLGGVAVALLALPYGGFGWSLGFFLMPVAFLYIIYAARLFLFRRSLLRNNDLYNPDMHSTKAAEVMGWVLFFCLSSVFALEVIHSGIKL